MKRVLKYWMKKLSPLPLSKNHRYDMLTKKIIRRHCSGESNCIDVGCYKGEVLDMFLAAAPGGIHYAFEPIPDLFDKLENKYANRSNCRLFNYAIGNFDGESAFNYVVTNPSYSGIKKRKYDRADEKDTIINVQTKKLDNIIPRNIKIDLVKIDVEGGEFDVLAGADHLIRQSTPLIIFEFGIGGSDIYGTTPEMIFTFFSQRGYAISLMDSFLYAKPALSLKELEEQFSLKKNYYFVAYPTSYRI